MIDINKLRYDLALNCALVDVLNMKKDNNFRTSSAMLKAFDAAYHDLCVMDSQNLKNLYESLQSSERTKTDLSKTIK